MQAVRPHAYAAILPALALALMLPAGDGLAREPAVAPPAAAAPTLAVRQAVLLTAVTGWVAAELGEPLPDVQPRIVFLDPTTLRALRLADQMLPPGDAVGHDVLALYRARDHTLFLPRGWSGASATEVSVLVHELVHHFQALRGDRHACPNEREKLAYEVQERWLQSHGKSLESAFGIDRLFLLLATRCLF
jgi:hypothetical protein